MTLTALPMLALALMVGLCIGSFLNVVIHRLPKMLERGWRAECAELAGGTPVDEPTYNLVVPRSACPSCARPIRAVENIPVVSYLMLGGKCAGCKLPISSRYPLVEVLTAILTVGAIVRFGANLAGLAACVMLWILVALTF